MDDELTGPCPPVAPPCAAPCQVFPLELTDEIIAFVWPDTKALLSCVLVCRRWLPAARFHLFRNIRLNSLHKYNALVSRVLRSDALHSYLAFVRSLNLADPLPQLWSPEVQGPRVVAICRYFVHDFAGHLPNLTRLTLSNLYRSEQVPHPSAFLALSTFPSISLLELRCCMLPSFASLRRIITALPSLTRITLDAVSWPQNENGDLLHLTHGAPRTTMRLKLSSLSFIIPDDNWMDECQLSHIQQLLTWLSGASASTTLRELQLELAVTKPEDYVDFFKRPSLSLFQPLVSRLSVKLPPRDINTSAKDSKLLQLSHFANLKSLDLNLSSNDWHAITQQLIALKELSLVRLHTLQVDTDIIPTNVEAEALDSLLDDKLFTELDYFDIDLESDLDYAEEDQIRATIRERLPKLTARGVLRIFF